MQAPRTGPHSRSLESQLERHELSCRVFPKSQRQSSLRLDQSLLRVQVRRKVPAVYQSHMPVEILRGDGIHPSAKPLFSHPFPYQALEYLSDDRGHGQSDESNVG